MYIPFIDLTRQSKKTNFSIIHKIENIIKDGTFILGRQVEEFEERFANYLGAKYCIGVGSGTDAILLSLVALNIDKGDEVIVPSFTFIASISPVIKLGAKPIIVDISANKPVIDPLQIEKVITKRTKLILPVHLYGYPCDMDKINKIAKKYKLYILEDSCQAHGSLYREKKVGTLGDISAFSFYPSKNLGAFGDAGAVVTSNKLLAQKIRILRDHGQRKKYLHTLIGYNSRLDTIQASVLKTKLPYLDYWNNKRRSSANFYTKLLSDLPIKLPYEETLISTNYHLYVIQVPKRDKLLAYLRNKNIFCGIHYPIPLHLQPALASLGYKRGSFPNSEMLAKTCLSLPIFPELTEREISFISNQIHKFLN